MLSPLASRLVEISDYPSGDEMDVSVCSKRRRDIDDDVNPKNVLRSDDCSDSDLC